jgi:hypothetical protein
VEVLGLRVAPASDAAGGSFHVEVVVNGVEATSVVSGVEMGSGR